MFKVYTVFGFAFMIQSLIKGGVDLEMMYNFYSFIPVYWVFGEH